MNKEVEQFHNHEAEATLKMMEELLNAAKIDKVLQQQTGKAGGKKFRWKKGSKQWSNTF